MQWNDEALRDQFYLNLTEELKDEIAPVGKPKTYFEMKTLAIGLDTRLCERRLERSNTTSRPPSNKVHVSSFHMVPPSHQSCLYFGSSSPSSFCTKTFGTPLTLGRRNNPHGN